MLGQVADNDFATLKSLRSVLSPDEYIAKLESFIERNLQFDPTNRDLNADNGSVDKTFIRQDHYRKLFQNHQAVKLIIDPATGQILDANNSAAKYYGWSCEEMRQMNISQINTMTKEEIRRAMQQVMNLEKLHFEFKHRRADGSVRDVEVLSSAIIESDTPYLQSIIIDITDRKQKEELIIGQNKQLAKLNAEKDKFFSIIAHDLKSPFHGLLGFSEIFSHSVREADFDTIMDTGSRIYVIVKRTYELLENLLEWAMLQRNDIKLAPKNKLLKVSVDSVITLYELRIGKKNLIVENMVPMGLKVFADSHLLNIVLRNLIYNSIKFTGNGGRIVIDAKPAAEMTEISVRDNGIGMNAAIKEKIFSLTGSVNRRGTDGEESTGLGLILSKEYVELNGGKIGFETKENEGTVFYFTVPSAQ